MIDGTKRTCMQFKDVRSFLGSILSEDTHAKRVDSLANAALGVMTGASLAVAMIGKSLAQARGLRLIPLSQVSLDSEPPTGHDRGRWPFLTRSSHFSNGFRTKRTAPSSCLSAAGRMASFVLGAVGSGVTC